MPFVKSDFKRENVWLRMILLGPTGAGKSVAALEVSTKLFGGSLDVGFADTEHGRGKLYADRYRVKSYGQIEDDFSPEEYVKAVQSLYSDGCGVIVLDSISHEWIGNNGVLQQADRFGEWKNVRPKHNSFVEALLSVPAHLIVTCRAKMKYEVSEEDVNGRTRQVIKKLGLGPVQSDDILYEFDVVGMVDASTHDVTFSNRCDPLVDTTRSLLPGDEVAGILTTWLSEGEPPVAPEEANPADIDELENLLLAEGLAAEVIEKGFAVGRQKNRGVLHPEWVAEKLAAARERAAQKAVDATPEPEDAPVEEPPPEAAEQLAEALGASA